VRCFIRLLEVESWISDFSRRSICLSGPPSGAGKTRSVNLASTGLPASSSLVKRPVWAPFVPCKPWVTNRTVVYASRLLLMPQGPSRSGTSPLARGIRCIGRTGTASFPQVCRQLSDGQTPPAHRSLAPLPHKPANRPSVQSSLIPADFANLVSFLK
jgi:hypothetical protein